MVSRIRLRREGVSFLRVRHFSCTPPHPLVRFPIERLSAHYRLQYTSAVAGSLVEVLGPQLVESTGLPPNLKKDALAMVAGPLVL